MKTTPANAHPCTAAFLSLLLLLPAACETGADDTQREETATSRKSSESAPADVPAAPPTAAPTKAPTAAPTAEDSHGTLPATWRGKVQETMNSGGYSYVHLDTGDRSIWLAGPELQGLAVGQAVTVPQGMLMTNFRSTTLDREFPQIYFVTAMEVDGAADSSNTARPRSQPIGGGEPAGEGKINGVATAAGGHTVAQILAQGAELAGKTVKVRGKVVKFSAQIMGRNWAHIQDGSGEAGAADVTVTTDATVQVGDTVLVEGVLAVDKDFGAGYRYAAIIEQAKLTVE